jgi:hypothetical protein
VTKPGNSGSEEPTQATTPDATTPDPATPEATTPDTAASEAADHTAETPADSAETPATPHESPTGASGGPPNSTLPEGTDNSGAGDVAEPAGTAKPAETAETGEVAASKPARSSAKARRAALMAELEKAPPPPYDAKLRAQAKRRFEEPPPGTLRFSLYFFVAAGGIWLLSMVASLIYKQDIIDNEIKRNTNPKVTPDQIAGAVNQILWIVTVAALAFTVFLALFGYKAREGTRRARTLVTIFAAVLVLFHLLLNGTRFGILSAMFALAGLALLWSPSARRYFAPRQVP